MKNFKQHFRAILIATVFVCANNVYATTSLSLDKLNQLAKKNDADAQFTLGMRYQDGIETSQDLQKAHIWLRKAANNNHATAQYQLGILYYSQKQYEKARYWLSKQAKAGIADAQFHYANTFRYGLGTNTEAQKARIWYQKAAEQGHKQAQYELALLYKNGLGTDVNTEKANHWFNEAANQGHKQAKKIVAKPTNKSDKRNSSLIQKAESGDKTAQLDLGKNYLFGKNIKKDEEQAVVWLKKAAENLVDEAQFLLGRIYLDGTDAIAADHEKARHWLSLASDNGYEKAEKLLDKLAKLRVDEHKQQQWNELVNAANTGSAETQYELGMHYILGYQTEKDIAKGVNWLFEAASQQHGLALYQLANLYMQGKHLKQDTNLAIHYFAQAEKQQIKPASTALNQLAEYGMETRVSAERGDKQSQYELAINYLGDATLSEQQKAIKWLERAAEQDHLLALSLLGDIYQSGILVAKNDETAFRYLIQAAKLNDAHAQYKVANMYSAGVGTQQDSFSASRWMTKAASQGLKAAQNALQFSGL